MEPFMEPSGPERGFPSPSGRRSRPARRDKSCECLRAPMTPDRGVIVDHQADTRGQMSPDLYISADIEADGPIPGKYSMLAFGLAVAGRFDGETFARRAPATATFYRELKPISNEFDVAALKVSGLDRTLLAREGADPTAAMHEAAG